MEGIDLSKYLINVPKHITGRIRYNPVNMLKIVLFGFMTSGYFINEILKDSVEDIFYDINQAIFEKEHVDLQHIYIDGSKFEANPNKYTWVWKKSTEKSRYRLYDKITSLLGQMNEGLIWSEISIATNTEYVPDYLTEVDAKYTDLWQTT